MHRWEDVEWWLCHLAADDLRTTDHVRPTLVAFAGRRPLLLVRCRAFAAGEGAAAVREILDIAVPLGADRIAMSFGGSARQLHGPAPSPAHDDPAVTRDVVVIAVTQRGDDEIDTRCTLHYVERARAGSVIAAPHPTSPVGGWLPAMLAEALAARPATPPSPEIIAAQAMYSITLGHVLHVPDGQEATTQ
jgi:hypothetical protein